MRKKRTILEVHKQLHSFMNKLLDDGVYIVRTKDVEKVLRLDLRTIKTHLTLCEIDGFGCFIEDNIFITKSGVRKITKDLGMKIEE